MGNSRLGKITIRVTSGRPRIIGVITEANKFSFILFLKGYFVFVFWLVLVLGYSESYALRLLIEK